MKRAALILLAVVVALLVLFLLSFLWTEIRYETAALADGRVPAPRPAGVRPTAPESRRALFGELHLHTSYSLDAGLFGTRVDPRTAYRFARGEPVELSTTGRTQQLSAPLDFAAVTDHAEGLGSYLQCADRGSGTYWSVECIGIRHGFLPVFPRLFEFNQQIGRRTGRYNPGMCGEDGALCIASAFEVWRDVQNAANEAYEPGRFTTFIGFEYSPTLDQGGMLHRNVIFRSDRVPDTVFSAFDGFAEDLLRWLDLQCTEDCAALSIPHNPNFSWGLMFGDRNSDGTPVTRENLVLRARYERLVEIFQAKGSSECATGLGNNDEQCDFERLFPVCAPGDDEPDENGLHARRCVAEDDMVRNVLRKGLVEQERLGFNPRQLGLVAATDNHNGLPGDVSESSFKGHGAANDDSPELRLGKKTTIVAKTLGFATSAINPGGLTGVWAEENTREAIFDALERREAFGTSGPRIRVRMFAGFGFERDLHRRHDVAAIGYAEGVSMGGELAAAAPGEAPRLVVQALRDVRSAPLDRIQIVKGWVVGSESRERVYDVACSQGRTADPETHRCPEAEAPVNLEDCSFPEERGAAELSATWLDPDFHADQPAFYYARVLERPTCRYTTYDANVIAAPVPESIPATIQERAWSSPIWYQPAGSGSAIR